MTRDDTIQTRRGLSYFEGNAPQIRSLVRAGARPTEFGHKVWASSLVLIDHLDTRPIPLRGKRVLEVGCGWGLLSIGNFDTTHIYRTINDLRLAETAF